MNIRPQLGLLILATVLNVTLPQIDVMYERLEQINGTDFADFRKIRVRKFNRTLAVLDGSYDLLRQLDDRYEAGVSAFYSSLGNNQFIHYPMKLASKTICDFFNTTWRDYQATFEHNSNLPKIGECPITPKTFYIKNHIAETSMIPPVIPRGLWRLRVTLTKTGDKDILGVLDLYAKVEMKGIF